MPMHNIALVSFKFL